MNNLRIAITDFVGFLCRQGDLSSAFMAGVSPVEGTQLHQYIQKSRPNDYQSEVPLSITHTFENELELLLSGRADGLFHQDDTWCIEEIKSTANELESIEPNNTHLAQAKLYAYIYAINQQLENMGIDLTYIHIETKQQQQFHYTFTIQELSIFYEELMEVFYQFYTLAHRAKTFRNQSIQSMTFPYESFRQGQKEMAISCFKAIKNHEVLFIQAPTGIGKTLSTLYPAVQSLGKHTSKIMYLTAKTITRQVAMDSLELMKSKGLYLSYVVLTAKEKICFLEKSKCHPDYCPFAKGHYDRINEALLDLLRNETVYHRQTIETYAIKHNVCPFELSLDLFNFSDVSISDYNYAFDPKVNLKRAFQEKNDYTLLVDEAHNLVDRARQMYSASLDLNVLKQTRHHFKPKKGKLYRSLKKIVDYIDNIDALPSYIKKEKPKDLIHLLDHFVTISKELLPQFPESELKEELLTVFFMCNDVLRIDEFYDENFITYYEDHTLKLFCLDASACLRPIYEKCQSVILFSATLLPISYFFSLAGGKEGDKKLYFSSPFPQENQLILMASDIQATYRKRSNSYDSIVRYLEKLMDSKQGHYLVFFPSYAYLNEVANRLNHVDVFIQNNTMTESDKEQFLNEFQTDPHQNKLFLCVLGGIFSEGIDLKGDQVIGVVIVSVGLPQICLERELIKEHFDEKNLGYDYAYVYPGFNKVLQAAGRLIRTMVDRGVVLLLDERYLTPSYQALFPQEWFSAKKTNLSLISKQLIDFIDVES